MKVAHAARGTFNDLPIEKQVFSYWATAYHHLTQLQFNNLKYSKVANIKMMKDSIATYNIGKKKKVGCAYKTVIV